MSLAALVERILSSPPVPRPVRFDDLVWAVRVQYPDADVCDIDREARPFERGAPGAYTYEANVCPCEGDSDDPGPHIAACRWNAPSYGKAPFQADRQRVLPWMEE